MTEYTYCPKCGAELTDYYNSIFELNVRDNIWVDVPVRQADCTNCDEQVLTTMAEKLIDDLKTGKRAVEPYSKVEDFIHDKYGYCYYDPKECLVYNLYIHPEYRNQGHAKRLLTYVINELKKKGCVNIKVEVKPTESNIKKSRLIKFYSSMGLIIIGE